jgi:hypothetical protein
MDKFLYLLWPHRAMTPAELRVLMLEHCGPRLLALGIDGLQVNLVDDRVTVKSPAPHLFGPKPFVAMVILRLSRDDLRKGCEALLQDAGFDLAGYRVDEWLYTEYGENTHSQPRHWPDGERSPGFVAITLIQRPPRIPKDEWMRRWFGWQSPMSEWMQPRSRYARNLVEEVVTPGAPALDGIVEESWPSAEHIQNPYLFYGARNSWELVRHMGIMLGSVTRMLRLTHLTSVMTSEYFLKSAPPFAGHR